MGIFVCIAIENNADHNLIIKMRITELVFESKTIKLKLAMGMNITKRDCSKEEA